MSSIPEIQKQRNSAIANKYIRFLWILLIFPIYKAITSSIGGDWTNFFIFLFIAIVMVVFLSILTFKYQKMMKNATI